MSDRGLAGGFAAVVEICVDDLAGALGGGGRRAPTGSNSAARWSEGGLTPSYGLVQAVLGRVRRIGVRIMIRPRSGNFVFSAEEVEVMLADIAAIRALPKAPGVAIGFVCGALTASDVVDARVIARLKAACGSAPLTFHKAFDATRDPSAALETPARAGHPLGADLWRHAHGGRAARRFWPALWHRRPGALPSSPGAACGPAMSARSLERTGVPEVHLRAMRPDAHGRLVTSTEEIAAFIRAARRAA